MNYKQSQTPQIPSPVDQTPSPRSPLTSKARRALAEAEARRMAAEEALKENIRTGNKEPKEILGPSGPGPTRYGDWENKGIASDF